MQDRDVIPMPVMLTPGTTVRLQAAVDHGAPVLKPKAVMALRQLKPLGAAAVGLCHAT